MQKTLIWKNKRSEDMGLKIISLPPIQLSTEKIDKKQVDGRDGDLTEKRGYQNDTKPVECDYRGSNPLSLLDWLQGSGEVIFGDRPDRYYKARINNIIPLNQILMNKMYNFTIQFDCQPFGYLIDGKEPLILTAPTVLYHDKATYYSLPDITIYGSGPCTFTINGRTFNITEIGGSITINSYLRVVMDNKGRFMEGYFPYLDIGENNISWSGNVTSVEFTPNWRCK